MCADEKAYLVSEWLWLVDGGIEFHEAAVRVGIKEPKNRKDGGRLGALRKMARYVGNDEVIAKLDKWRIDRDIEQRQKAALSNKTSYTPKNVTSTGKYGVKAYSARHSL